MVYAIFQNGGKQYRVSIGQVIRLERVSLRIGAKCVFGHVMMISSDNDIRIGHPYLFSCSVSGEVVQHGRGPKVLIVKFRRRKHFRKSQGHRQWFTDVRINSINM